MDINKTEFDLLRKHIYNMCGLIIGEGKEYLIVHRLKYLFKEKGCKSWLDFYHTLLKEGDFFKEEVISAISTHETSFFRDYHPFDSIRKKVLPRLVQNKKSNKKIRIWCAAASTGQEPYTLSMIVHDLIESVGFRTLKHDDFSIVATDISGNVLEKAQEGLFSEREFSRGLPDKYTKYFSQEGKQWKVSPSIRSIVSFQKLNLLESFRMLGQFDFVLCRNVLIYFDDKTKLDIVHRIHSLLPEDGYLLLGATESLAGQTDRFVSEHEGTSVLYRKQSCFSSTGKKTTPVEFQKVDGLFAVSKGR
ncbi:protein-glutamate O-methyltransferase CheR [Maridesulfovibrio ferrireducens]|uniref:CheR family methyltransferase n=1 Tax=Maridesulfovibrio ferrireducens TaxID=246191 RepID=UPI001A24B2C4|nr:protein-glutamate O-methyltransferase CheR [Maridesulfovibrio ferrireducens]MBI9111842.1 protein-glutamate O-methyltransferase CheR [Maridesulfovibrio ferrireducens]